MFYSFRKYCDAGGRPSSTPRRNTSTLGDPDTLHLFGVGYQTWHNTAVLSRLARRLARHKQTMRIVITLILLATFSAGCTEKKMNQDNQNTSRSEASATDPLAIHKRAIAIDMHVDTVQRILDEHVDIQQQLRDGHFDAVRARSGNLDAQFFSIWVEPQLFGGGGARAVKRADDQIEAIRTLANKHPETWEIATSGADIRRAAQDGKIAALFGLEGGYAIDEKLENVKRYYYLGVRYMSPAWSVST